MYKGIQNDLKYLIKLKRQNSSVTTLIGMYKRIENRIKELDSNNILHYKLIQEFNKVKEDIKEDSLSENLKFIKENVLKYEDNIEQCKYTTDEICDLYEKFKKDIMKNVFLNSGEKWKIFNKHRSYFWTNIVQKIMTRKKDFEKIMKYVNETLENNKQKEILLKNKKQLLKNKKQELFQKYLALN